MSSPRAWILLALLFCLPLWPQVSSSTARHIGWGSSLPAKCNPLTGDVFTLINIGAVTGVPYSCTASNTWTAMSAGSGGTGDAAGYTPVTFSSTPTFAVTKNTAQSFLITLTGNVTSSTLSTSGITNSGRPLITFRICQDSGGAHSFVWPANVQNPGVVIASANACSNQSFVWDGTNLQAIGVLFGSGVSTDQVCIAGSTSGNSCIQAPATSGATNTLPPNAGTLPAISGTPTTGNCTKWISATQVGDSGSTCGGGGGGLSVNGPWLLNDGTHNFVAPFMTQQSAFSTTGYTAVAGSTTVTTLGNGVVNLYVTGSGAVLYGRSVSTFTQLIVGAAGGCLGGNYGFIGVYLGDTVSGHAYVIGIGCNSTVNQLLVQHFTYPGNVFQQTDYQQGFTNISNPVYFKIDWSSSSATTFSVSNNGGATWEDPAFTASYSTMFGGNSPTAFGIVVDGSTTGSIATNMQLIHYAIQ